MKSRLFCKHCDKHFEVDIKMIKLMKKHSTDKLSYAHNTYFYNDSSCFFKNIKQIKNEKNI